MKIDQQTPEWGADEFADWLDRQALKIRINPYRETAADMRFDNYFGAAGLLRQQAEQIETMRAAIVSALGDSESGKGWGPDVTVCARLKKSLPPPGRVKMALARRLVP